ncbi:ABC transporter permease [Actinophytocola algeriensis]|uniref:Peptide/nickel transport system permease protein n=1 Tax=Actinophytocola algeriensis TaxID=1768010 RepID=A0A7W7Q210_9PSEU|nr:ABC transporter permease [Actinophytocola algeriensis]MBB4905544.1 peptide/nickel transport system permease protein [Actinophytocola algeriensis]MBE1472771.1 peptide/nickel transport system permease protein [Actinophytocola algeriensis]
MTQPKPEPDVPVAAGAAEVATVPGVAVVHGGGVRREALHFAVRNRKLVGGFVVVLVFLLAALVGPLFASGDPNAYVGPAAAAPSGEYWFGTTTFGQDVFAQFLHGLRASFFVGVVAALIAGVLGMVIGFTSGYRGGLVDEVLNMITNIVLVLPVLAVLMIIAAYLEVRDVQVQAVIIGLFSWPWVARAVRSQTLTLRAREFVDLAKLSGMPVRRIIFREIAPNMASYLFMVFILLFGGSVLFAATLDFIGLGPTEGTSLGLMLNQAKQWSAMNLGLWWWFIPPGLGITTIVGALYLMNVGLDEVFNPKLRET